MVDVGDKLLGGGDENACTMEEKSRNHPNNHKHLHTGKHTYTETHLDTDTYTHKGVGSNSMHRVSVP